MEVVGFSGWFVVRSTMVESVPFTAALLLLAVDAVVPFAVVTLRLPDDDDDDADATREILVRNNGSLYNLDMA